MKPSIDDFFAPVACVRPPLQIPTLQRSTSAPGSGVGARAGRAVHSI